MAWGIHEVREEIRERGAVEIVSRYLDKIEKSRLNSFITIAKDSALLQARRIDKEDRGRDKGDGSEGEGGRLAGVPIAIKDNISTRGILTTCASRILSGYIPPYDAHVITNLLNEGAVIVGKTNMDEFAMGSSTETSAYGATRNPWAPDRVPGGSSGGSAAAVAAGEVPVALGSDTGGSIRCPASFCGIAGLKPTYGAVSRYGLVAYASSLDQIGPFASNVSDLALLFDIISGMDRQDSTSADTEKIGEPEADMKGVRIGVPGEYFGEGIDTGVEKAVWNAIHTLEGLGASYTEVGMPHTKYALAAYYIIAMSEASSNLARFDGMRYGLRTEDKDWHTTFSQIRAAGFGEEVKRRILLGTYALSAGYHEKYYLKALKVRTLIRNDFEHAFKNVDVLAAPTMPFPAFRIGERISDPLTLYLADVDTVAVNLAGVPAVSVPCGFTQGLPAGLQLIGRHFDEKTILSVAYAFEQSTDFHTKHPEAL
ncbi:MAG TPA: Asp-tRNA(Asn)/Glu-tRNA(Gln) amidotransferase subunit GatA [Candidatus Methanoperedenaceae archaeon]|nr:Asp-tRNA(Asn)/Glu-tRNA(Gln) amidotransferase subunit GatA [Candidatus Methanoperedenaceae archaeon]